MTVTRTTKHDWKTEGLLTVLGVSQGGKLLGTQYQPRDIAAFLYAVGFTDAQVLSDAIKVCLAESQGYDKAYNDNLGPDGMVSSRDVGIMQINIAAKDIGTQVEFDLYDVKNNVTAAFKLWSKRGFEPWVSYTSAVYLRDTYLKRANRGLGNYFGALDLAKTPTDTIGPGGESYVHILVNPVLDFEYRVIDQHNSIEAGYRAAAALKSMSTVAALKTQGSKVAAILQQALNIPKT